MRRRVIKAVGWALAVVIPLLAVQSIQRVHSQGNHAPSIQSFTSSKDVIDFCPFVEGGSCTSGTIVTLEVKAKDSDNDHLTYEYSVSGGVIEGSGSAVKWNLRAIGKHTAQVTVKDGRGGKTSGSLEVNAIVCGACDPPCPTLSVSCPDYVAEGEVVVFAAVVSGEELTYGWSHTNGKRIAKYEGSRLRIAATGSPGDVVKATVEVFGLAPECNRQASCESKIEKRKP